MWLRIWLRIQMKWASLEQVGTSPILIKQTLVRTFRSPECFRDDGMPYALLTSDGGLAPTYRPMSWPDADPEIQEFEFCVGRKLVFSTL